MSVWPDARIKSSPIFTKVAQKGAKVVFYIKEWFLKWHKSCPNIGLILCENMSPELLKSKPIWSHCIILFSVFLPRNEEKRFFVNFIQNHSLSSSISWSRCLIYSIVGIKMCQVVPASNLVLQWRQLPMNWWLDLTNIIVSTMNIRKRDESQSKDPSFTEISVDQIVHALVDRKNLATSHI